MDAPRLTKLSPEEKRALLARLLQRKLGKAPVASPLSAGQRALWFLHRLDPESAAYNLHFCARFRSPLDAAAFRRTLEAILARHSCLRSTFVDRGGGPVQLVYEALEPSFDVVEAAGWSDDRLRDELHEEAHRPFSLEKGPVLRTKLFHRKADDNFLLMTVHHIVSDFWTLGVLIDEVRTIYPAAAAGRESTLPPTSGEYADFVRWQEDLLAGPEGLRHWDYWREKLAGELPILNLPTDRPRPPVQTDRGATWRFGLGTTLAARLKDFARAEGATLFAVLLAAYQAMLHRLTGQDDLLVGSPVAGRSRSEFAGLVGYFVNMIALRANLSGRPSFRSLLSETRQSLLDGLRHGDFPFARLVERLQPARDLSRHSLFQAAFVLKRSQSIERNGAAGQASHLHLGGLVLEPIELDQQAVPFDWNLLVEEVGEDLTCSLQYSTDLFDASTIERWMNGFKVLLEAVVTEPDRPLAQLPLFGSGERAHVLALGRGPVVERPNVPLHRLIEEQVARTPDSIALSFEGEGITYRELNERANRLARHLRMLGAGTDVPIALCLERSFEMVVGLLAVLKAGAAYVPLDPDLPRERLEFLLADLEPPAVLTLDRHVNVIPPDSAHVVRLDADAGAWANADRSNPDWTAAPGDLAYIIYTSGSTGQPKGCANTHGGIVNRLLWMQETYLLTSNDCILQKTPFGFDVAVWEFFWPLMSGARLAIAKPGGHRDPDYLVDTIARDRVSVLHFVPSMLQVFLGAEDLQNCTALRDVICSGEALTWDLQSQFFAQFPGVRLHNLYGPTEAAVDVTFWQCDADEPRRIVPIGRPVSNTRIQILDASQQPTPIGVPGELHIGGVQLAREYWRRPELTAERFIPDPNEPGHRLYKTGDLCRLLADGAIEYLGRLDHQVKIRGFRIELGEIEAILALHPDVREGVVTARKVDGDTRLIAYLVPQAPAIVPSTSELRSFLAGKLPEYMIPAVFVALESLPLSANGKIDRKALPIPDVTRPDLAVEYIAPRTPTEIRLAKVWVELLRVERVGCRDGFFELGGHSLLATQVLSRIRADFGVELPLRQFFEVATLGELAAEIDEHAGPAPIASLASAPLRPAPRDEALPMSFGQETLWFLDQLEPGNTTYNVPAAIRLAGPLDFEATRRAFEAIVHRHESLRSTFALENEQRVVRIREPEFLPLDIIDLRELPPAERETRAKELTEIEARKPFDLAAGPLLRISVLRVGDLDQIMLMTVHHIAYDGWSTGVLVNEFATLYRGFLAGRNVTLARLPIQYPDLAYWQRQWQSAGLLDPQLAYWKKQLQGIPPLLALPTDRPRPQVWSFRGATLPLHFPPSLVADLRALSKREGCTFFMTLLAAFQTLLHRYSGMDDICVGSPIANRNRVEVEGLIGFVVNTLVLRGNLSGNPTFTELMRRTRETALGAYANQDLPFERLMQALHPQRDVRHSSLFQVLFVLQNAPVHLPPLPNLTPRLLLDSHNGTAKFDLTLGLTEMPEGLVGLLEYNCDLFDVSTIERMAAQFGRLLDEIVADANRRLTDLPILADADRQHALACGEGDVVEPIGAGCFHRRFESQVERHLDETALVWGDERLSYGELNASANRLAHELRVRGVVPESIVALCFERSVEMIVGLLAVLKAGGAYLPLDPALPRERLGVILDDAAPVVVLTQRRLAGDLPFDPDRILRLDTDSNAWSHHPGDNLPGGATAKNLAYVIYTSGSTGVPKGCMIEHGSLDNSYVGWEVAYDLTHLHAYLQMANFAFDVFTGDLVRAFGAGGKLVLCPTETLLDPEKMLALIRREDIDYAEFVPAVVRPVLRHLEATRQNLAPVRLVVCGSDVWYGGEFRRLRRVIGDQARLVNSYGLTEATIDNLYYDGPDEGLQDDGPIPIGRPYANQRAVVLDSELHVQPIGVPGELHCGGVALARGYLNRPELTAEKFIADPFHPGERLYKSGDLARLLPGGSIELLGRTDNQVKIRGFRIELGEIEVTIAQHPSIHESIVVAREDVRGIKRLVAYIVLTGGAAAPSAAELRGFLGGKLPEYMVPAVFVPLTALPLTPNGKIDRKSLPAPDPGRGELAAEYVPPRTHTEIQLAALWSDVLRAERVGLRDSFFELGGHSLLATQVLARVRAEFGVELPLRRLFETPTLADFATAIDAAERAKQGPALERVAADGGESLSYAQQRLWFLDQLEPGNPVYHVATAVRMNGQIDRAVWERCLLEIIARHDVLRTAFPAIDGRPIAIVAPSVALNVRDVDLSQLPSGERETRARAEALAEYSRPFNLASGPLFHIALLKLAPTEHVLLLTMHHIIADGGSLAVFLAELGRLYTRFAAGQSSPLPPLPIQYSDFARWQQQWFEGGERERQARYWRERLSGAPAALELPTDRPRPPIQTSRGATLTRVLAPALAEAVAAISHREGVTPYMTLLAAFQVLLNRSTGQDDLLIGTPVSNRNRVEVEGLIGFFVNTIVLRSDLTDDPTFRDLLIRTREEVMQALAHQELPFESLVETLQPRRDPSRTPLFQVMFAYQSAPTVVQLPGLKLQTIPIDHGTAMFDLTLLVTDDEGQLVVSAEYNSDLYDSATIARMLRHFELLLGRLTNEPNLDVASATLLEDDERSRILTEWNATTRAYSSERTVCELIADRAALQPDAIAVEDADGQRLSYAELERRAAAVANQLANAGAGRNAVVGIMAERSLDMAVGLLGILKSGAAYLPLDPAYPDDRLAFLLADAGCKVVVVEPERKSVLPSFNGAIVTIGDPAATPDQFAPAQANDAVCIIYTSGSTGEPKGVVLTHRNLLNACLAAIDRFNMTAADRVLQFTSLSFDVAAEEIFPAWVCGATVVLRPRGPIDAGAEFLRFVDERRVTFMELPTTYWHELTADLAVEPLSIPESLRLVVVGREAARPEAAAAWRRWAGDRVRWINAYGPTETTVTSIVYEPEKCESLAATTVPIGRPLANTRAYVLDQIGRLSPIGLPGELVIAGDGVARGYLNRPELTAARFAADPFVPNGRMYRTGDRARWRADGQLEFLGRYDDQVKVRGFRVEPGEIEASLARHPGVRTVAAVTRPDSAGQLQIVVYFVPTETDPADSDSLMSYLRGQVPEYMIPSAVVELHEMPTTAGGKIDRQALPAPGIARVRQYVAPRTPTEEKIAVVWADLFALDRVGSDDSFFELGGHSLLAVQLASRLSRTLDREVAVRAIILYPTVAALADAIDRNAKGTSIVAADHRFSGPAGEWINHLNPFVRLERRSFLDLSEEGKLAPVHGAAIGYLPSALLHITGMSRDEVIERWCGDRPIVSGVLDLDIGRIATILIPRFDTQLYEDQNDLVAVLGEALRMAGQLGAETVSLTGLLPSATEYGLSLARAMAGQPVPKVTTGHAATTATVVLSIRRLLAEAGRDMARERVAFIGLGSIGTAVLRLMLERLPHPAAIRLCDMFSKRDSLLNLRRQIQEAGYAGPVDILEAQGAAPADVYDSTFYVGATNVADILDIERLPPGALIVDDSAPHCFRIEKARRRLRDRGDILFTEGGTLSAPQSIRQSVYLPEELEPIARILPQDVLPMHDPRQITGCILSSVLAKQFPHLTPTLGLIKGTAAADHYEAMTKLGFHSAPLHCENFIVEPSAISNFRNRFGESTEPRVAASSVRGIDWRSETALDPAITGVGLPPVRAGEPATILLTGATGFLGAFLLDDLLRQTSAQIVCLARAGSTADAMQRIRRTLNQYAINLGDRASRIVPLAGDLALPRFGLSDEHFAYLASETDVIYHNGAQVHFLHPYSTLKPANVLGTQHVLRLATTNRLKPVQFVSTLSVLAGISHGQPALEVDRNDRPELLENGYAQSKWVSERLIWAAIERNVPASVFRPGRIVWHSRTGALNQDDVFTRALRVCIQLAAMPAIDATLEMTPVDYVSRVTVALGQNRAAWGQAYHLFNRQYVRLRQLLDWVRAYGYPLEVMPPEQWLVRVQESATADAQDALAGLLPLLANGVPFLAGDSDTKPLPGPNFDDRNTHAALVGTTVSSPAISAEVVAVYLDRLVAEGLLTAGGGKSMRPAKPATNGKSHGHSGRPRTHGTK